MQEVFREIKNNLYFRKDSYIDFPPHLHDDIELMFVEAGQAIAYCDGREYNLTPNSFFIAFPNQIHHYSQCTNGTYYCIIVKPSHLLHFVSVFSDGLPLSALHQHNDDSDNLISIFKTTYEEYLKDGDSSIISAYLTIIFGKLLKCYDIEKSRLVKDCTSSILQYCAKHYKENISIDDISKELHISRSHISHIFSKRLNINFCDYINSLRLSDAVAMLESERYSVTEISDKSGFSTIRTFNRAFYKKYNTTPSEYRKIKP